MYLFHCVDICTDDANAMVGKTAGPFICIKEVAPQKNQNQPQRMNICYA